MVRVGLLQTQITPPRAAPGEGLRVVLQLGKEGEWMGEAITLPMWQFMLAGAGFIVTCVVNTWGVIKYMIGRQDKHTNELRAEIKDVRDRSVSKEHHDREISRMSSEITRLTDTMQHQGQIMTQRLDTILLAIGKSGAKT